MFYSMIIIRGGEITDKWRLFKIGLIFSYVFCLFFDCCFVFSYCGIGDFCGLIA